MNNDIYEYILNAKHKAYSKIKVELCMYVSHGSTIDQKTLNLLKYLDSPIYPPNWTSISHSKKKSYYYKNLFPTIDKIIKTDYDLLISKNIHTYNNPVHFDIVKSLMQNDYTNSAQHYTNIPVLYFFIIPLKDLTWYNTIFCKIGYTNDLITELKTTKNEYGGAWLISVIPVNRVEMYNSFHTHIKLNKPHLIYDIIVDNVLKENIYIFDNELYKDFMQSSNHV